MTRRNNTAIWAGVALGALVVIGSIGVGTDASNQVVEKVMRTFAWVGRVIRRVSRNEGNPDSVNLNTDRAGLSWGIIQWAQAPGTLGVVLTKCNEADLEAFRRIFGSSWSELLRVTNASSEGSRLAPVGVVVLWAEPWVSRFREAGRHTAFQDTQYTLAAEGEHFQVALATAKVLNVRSERAMAVVYDRAVQQGNNALKIAESLVAKLTGDGSVTIDEPVLLRRYVDACAGRFRRTSTPSSMP